MAGRPQTGPARVCEGRALLAGVREEQLLAADLVAGDGRLAGGRHHPVDKALGERLLPHGPTECRAAQLDIFNDSKESAA